MKFRDATLMKQLLPYAKSKRSLALLGMAAFLVVVVLGATLTFYAVIPGQGNNQETMDTSERLTRGSFKASFFRENSIGQAIVAYLTCIDFECFDLKAQLKKQGGDAVLPLIYLLKYGLPRETSKEVSGDIKLRVISLLGAVADARAVSELTAVLRDSDPVVRAAAAGALGQIGDDAALGALLPLLQDPDQLVRETTAIALGRLGRSESLPALRKALEIEQYDHVRKAMAEAIKVIEKR